MIIISKVILLDETLKLSLDSFELYNYLISKNEFVLSKQFFRAVTSIGANLREARYAESKKDFIHKYRIALKECNEALYWLELINHYEKLDITTTLQTKCSTILRMLTKAIKTTQQNTL